MNRSSLRKVALPIFTISILTLSITPAALAKKGGNGGGKPPPPPTVCTDEFPGFTYGVEATRRSPGEIHLASTDGCRSELVWVESADGRGGGPLHMTADRSKGVLLWKEEPDNAAHYVVYRQDFTVNLNGDLNLETPVKLLPPDGEEVPAADHLYYFSMDIWGDATHESLYLAVWHMHVFGLDSGDVIEELLIYNLNDMTDMREIYRSAQLAGEWNCPDVDYPQFVPTCYTPNGIHFNPSGTRLYISDNFDDKQGQRWNGSARLHIDRIDLETAEDLPLKDWTFSTPELVYTATDSTAGGMLARPDYFDPSQLPSQEFIAVRYSNNAALLDADQCASDYAPFAGGSDSLDPNFWHACLDSETITVISSFLHGGGDSWQSPDALLSSLPASKGSFHYNIYRRNISGVDAGTEQLLIEWARGADSGY